ncbi:glutamate-ammonia-ligase adenylyltransferase [Leucobacter exalbidus]|uniref:Glutamate-ammonia-ligase adenylyltransferase n=1 Tax=Leucobacter exalbidus TaxID=662960 RepID=A0A940PL69_9MICO|nr:bifunctional [glutamine synthetase] adenylyltransferase/[glutamine synthetase]-adenylyl-L-tyrosine phosphorylase [Leucobacter exalbidus]MBP1325180.1 glutamate-ammonia-ligase adenylyltransferase [Leucobacter exalbidus]
MAVSPVELRLADVARAGFQELGGSRELLGELAAQLDKPVMQVLNGFVGVADPDAALTPILRLVEQHQDRARALDSASLARFCLLVGASPALGNFFIRHPERLEQILAGGGRVIGLDEARSELLRAIGAAPDALPGTPLTAEAGWVALRTRYRELLAELSLYDLLAGRDGRATDVFEEVAHCLSDLAAAAIDASLQVARATLLAGESGPPIQAERLAAVRLGIVGMGKCGAQELNVVSDVDVIFVVDSADESVVEGEALIRYGTRLASETMRGIQDPALEPPLWELDPNLRPEGRQGPLVRTPGSMQAYYSRWAKAWEFQALLKARPLAGDLELAADFTRDTREAVWTSASRTDFVGSVQRMRQRVTEHIADEDLEVQLKLGPGGLRDIEFSAQLLQLVHGQYDDRLHVAGTLDALRALVEGGYIARADGERLGADYRLLRVLEHRLQLQDLRRTAIMPTGDDELRVLARASGLAATGSDLRALWEETKREVRKLHLKIFYAPLLSAVAALPDEELVLGSDAALARLSSIGFRDPAGAMRHLAALTRGTTRRARIRRNLMPVLLGWLSNGTDPDYGLLAFRRVSEANLGSPWYLRLLRDGTDAAERLMRVLSSSRFTADLLESIPDAVAWLERDEHLAPRALAPLVEEMRSLASRRDTAAEAAVSLRAVHRREVLRLAMGRVTGVLSDAQVSGGLDAAHTALLDALLSAVRRDSAGSAPAGFELALIGMGRFGGGELGFASDIDLVAVYRGGAGENEGAAASPEAVSRYAMKIVGELRSLVSDPKFPVDLDFDLRPEGKNGPIARSLESYRSYYARWSVTWEAQALLRARAVAGDAALGKDFMTLADELRFPPQFPEDRVREVRRMKARVEAERLPRGGDPRRQLKLGPGGVSDVEWLVQLLQLEHGGAHESLRTVSTLGALASAVKLDLIDATDAEQLEESWEFASSVRSALKLWNGRGGDFLPTDWNDLEGITGVLGWESGRTTELEERWLTVSRRARKVTERVFFGYAEGERFPLQ